ncbi:hypothetical protein [Microcoleus vaginatus]|uniref:hypothetical protein n=1 Tax=Microcoleus vaginatus TaxID=119532 RepID=UPI001F606AA3|nr:hypothetical protein D0A37_11365 [Microcoleus vaginatus HSN003]
MKAESEVSIFFALSIFSNEKFKADDDRLNYQSYKELGLICGQCRELVFFKQGIERVSHFSHFRDTGKDCPWRTESHSNTQSSDSFKREQSLQEFQTKFRWIIEQGIIKHQQISESQLREQIKKGQKLVSTYKIDIDSWLRWFNQNREQLGNLAKSLYQSNELVSEENQIILLNFVDYLCVPASEDILRDILYYVFGLLDKEISLNKYLEEVCSKVIEIIIFAGWEEEYEIAPIIFKGIDHPNVEEKTPKGQIKVEQQTPKPIKLENEKVGVNQVEFTDIIATVPMLLRLTPGEAGYKLVGLPIKLPPELTYDSARYIASNLGMGALGYLNNEVARIKGGSESMIGRYTRRDMIDALNALITGIKASQKIDPANVLISKNKLKAYMSQQEFYSSPTDQYYSFYPLASVKIIQETESIKYSYRLTNFGDPMALIRANLSSIQTWVQRLNYNLKNYFGVKKPSFDEIRQYLKDYFKFKNCDLKVYYDNGIFFEVWHQGKLVTKQLITIIDPANAEKTYNLQSVNIARNIQFGDNRIFEKVLKCNNILDSDLIRFAKGQLSKVVDKFITANEKKLVGKDKVAQTSKVRDLLGFGKTSKGFSNIKSTFLKFIRPFSNESEVNRGKVLNLRTGKTLDQHSANELLEKMTANWKEWDRDKDQTIQLGGIEVKKPNPGKLMLEVHNKISDYPHLDQLVWGDLIEVWWQLTQEPIGFRTSSGVILTPWSIKEDRVDIWQYRIKMQLIDILRDQKTNKGEVTTIEAHLQLSRKRLREILDTVYPNWQKQVSEDILRHLDALENALELAKKAAKL